MIKRQAANDQQENGCRRKEYAELEKFFH
jgi:hypothetical protein